MSRDTHPQPQPDAIERGPARERRKHNNAPRPDAIPRGPVRERGKHRAAFELWYANDRRFAETAAAVPVTQENLRRWIKAFQWHDRADALDMEATRQADRAMVARRVKLIEAQRRAGELLRRRGVEFLAEHPLDLACDAIRAIKDGIQLERSAEGLPQFLAELLVMTDDQLRAERERVFRRLASAAPGPPALGAGGEDDDGDDDGDGADPVLSPGAY